MNEERAKVMLRVYTLAFSQKERTSPGGALMKSLLTLEVLLRLISSTDIHLI